MVCWLILRTRRKSGACFVAIAAHIFGDLSCAELSLYSSCLYICDCRRFNSGFRSCYAKMSATHYYIIQFLSELLLIL
jgi:hypothetical protein